MGVGFVSENTKVSLYEAEFAAAKERIKTEKHRKRIEEQDRKSLYDVLQENKAKKKAEYEADIAAKNQAYLLNEEQVTFLDELALKQKEKNEAHKRELEKKLEIFKEHQKQDHKSSGKHTPTSIATVIPRKFVRKRKQSINGIVIKHKQKSLTTGPGIGEEKLVKKFKPFTENTNNADPNSNVSTIISYSGSSDIDTDSDN